MSLEHETAALYRGHLKDFVAERQQLAATLKKAGRAADAATVKALTKPSRSAWAVNAVFWHDRPAFDAVVEAGTRLRAAQHARLSGDTAASVVAAVAERDRAIALAVRAADARAREAGEGLTPELRQRVTLAFETIAARPVEELSPAPGRLVGDLGPAGFDAMVALAPPATEVAVTAPVPAASRPESRAALRLVQPRPGDRAARAAALRRAREQALETAELTAERARRAAEAAQAASVAATAALSRARDELIAREEALRDAQRARETAARELARAQADVTEAADAAQRMDLKHRIAEQAVAACRTELAREDVD